MPPIRTQNKKSKGKSALPGSGFTPGIGLEANERATAAAKQCAKQSARDATLRLTSETEEARLFNEGTATIGESEEACELAPNQAELAVKEANAVEKISMPMDSRLKEVIFQVNQEWESYHQEWLGHGTKRVAFSSGFVLKEYVPSHKFSHSRLHARTDCQTANISTS